MNWTEPAGRWRRVDWAITLALLLAPLATYWRLWAPEPWRRWFPDGDFTDQFFAFARFETAELARGVLPTWNPLAYAGTPFWADVQSAVAYPPSLLNAVLHALTLGWMTFAGLELEAVAHLGLAGALMFAFARDALGSRAGAVVAAVTFSFGGFLTGYPPLQLAVLETAVWLPLVLLGIRRAVRARDAGVRPWLGFALAALGIACAILAGHPQTALYLLYAAASYAVWHGRLWRRTRWQLAGWLTGAAALGVAASAAGWLPALAFQQASNRVSLPYVDLAHGFPPAELAGLVVTGLTQWAPLYVGLVPLILALGAVGASLDRSAASPHRPLDEVRFWAAVGVVALLLALGANGPLFDAAYVAAPGWDLFRGQERAAYIVSFSLSMLAGAGAGLWLVEGVRVRRFVLRAGPALAAVLLVALAFGQPSTVPGALRGLIVLAGLVALAVADGTAKPLTEPRVHTRRLSTSVWLTAVVALTLFDVVPATHSTNLASRPPDELAVSPVVATLRATGAGRVVNHDRLPRNFGVLHGFEATTGASPLWLRTWGALTAALEENEPRLWQLLAVTHVVTWQESVPVPAFELVAVEADDGPTRVFALESPMPRAWRVSVAELVDDATAVARIAASDFNPLETVLLQVGEPGVFPASSRSLAIQETDTGRMATLTSGDAPAWIVFSEMYDTGWRATVDGVTTAPLRADIALIAVPVPAGEHTVAIEYAPPLVRAGLAVSAAAWLTMTLCSLAAYRGRPAPRSTDTVLT